MPKIPLTSEQKALKQKKDFWLAQFQRAKTAFSFGRIGTMKELLLILGHSEGEIDYAHNGSGSRAITFNDIKALEQKYLWDLEFNQYENNTSQVPQEHEYEGYKYPENISGINIPSPEILPKDDKQSGTKEEHKDHNTGYDNIDWDSFFASPLQTAKLRGAHQRNTAKSIYQGFHDFNTRGILLEGGAGNGKTYVCAAVVRKLFDDPKFFASCISPWPVLWITRASIVEQTKRVVENDFGLCPHTEVIVINVEQLRAKFGKWMVDDKTIVKGGEEHIVWTWKERFHPMLFIIDECQLAKNEDSTQAKIISAISEIKEKVHVLFLSATPFTRISEAKYFIVNCGMEIKI